MKKLPASDRSYIIRAAFSRYSHPARLQGYTTFTLLQQIPVFVIDFDEGRHTSYTELISTNYIAAEKPWQWRRRPFRAAEHPSFERKQ